MPRPFAEGIGCSGTRVLDRSTGTMVSDIQSLFSMPSVVSMAESPRIGRWVIDHGERAERLGDPEKAEEAEGFAR